MIKIIHYKNKNIIVKENKVFILNSSDKSTLSESNDINTTNLMKLKDYKVCKSVKDAKKLIDEDSFDDDDYALPSITYQIITNPGESDEHTEELLDMNLAQTLFDELKIDPDPSYKFIKFVKFDYDNDSEEILDWFDFVKDSKNNSANESIEKINEDAQNQLDDELSAVNFEILGQLVVIKNKIVDAYNDFNNKYDKESLKYDLNTVKRYIDIIINRL